MRGFDDAGRDAALVPPLIQGLQDPSPLVREPAADALRDFIGDPNVQKWLRWAAENDPDPAVRKEAVSAFINNRRYLEVRASALKESVGPETSRTATRSGRQT